MEERRAIPRRRARRRARLVDVRRRDRHPEGRAWINGREVGGTDPRWTHLTRSYD